MRAFAFVWIFCFVTACGRTTLDDSSTFSGASGLGVDAGRVVAPGADAGRITASGADAEAPDGHVCQWILDPQVSYPVAWSPWSLAVGDFNGDGRPDVAAASTDETSDGLAVWLNNGDGTMASPVTYDLTSGSAYGSSWSVVAGDFNADQQLDLAVIGNTGSEGGILFNRGNGTFAPQVPFFIDNAGAFDLAASDFDGDGSLDLVVANGDETVGVLLNAGDGSFSHDFQYRINGGAWTVAVADFDGDGHPDLAVAASPNTVNILINHGDGTFALPVIVGLDSYNELNSVVASDFNGDGRPDLACTFNQGRGAAMWLNRGDGSFAPEVDFFTSTWSTDIAATDFDGDGRMDFAIAVDGSTGGTVSVFLNAGGGTFQSPIAYVTGTDPNALGAADFNGDGHPDLAVANVGDHTLGLLLSACR